MDGYIQGGTEVKWYKFMAMIMALALLAAALVACNPTDTTSPTTSEPESFTITATAGTHGSIDPAGSVTVDYGDSPTFTITADPGYKIADVVVDGESEGPLSTLTFSDVNADHTINATFEPIPIESLGEPVPGAEIYIVQEPDEEPVASVVTDENGIFTFDITPVLGTGETPPETMVLNLSITPPADEKYQLPEGTSNVVYIEINVDEGPEYTFILYLEAAPTAAFAVGSFSSS
jgi:hypothetical protein